MVEFKFYTKLSIASFIPKIYLGLLLLLFYQSAICEPTTNLNIIDSLLKESYSQSFEKFYLNNQDTLCFMFSDMVFSDYYEKSLIDYAFANNIKLKKVKSNQLNESYIKIMPVILDISYQENLNNYIRIITLNFSAVEIYPNGEINSKFDKKFNYTDTLKESDLRFIENEAFPISKGKKKDKELGFLDKILEPVIIVATSALTVILFFTVRSK